MRDHSAIDFDTQLLRAAMTKLEDLGEPFTDEEHELRAECSALMGRLVRLRNGKDGDETQIVLARVRAVAERVSWTIDTRQPASEYSPTGESDPR